MLRQAASQLRQLPEAAEAACGWHSPGGGRQTVLLLERVSQIAHHLPMGELSLVANAALAQALRAQGKLTHEAAAWERASAVAAPAALKLHAHNGAAISALSRAQPAALANACGAASLAMERLASEGEEALAKRWKLTFQVHETLGGLVGRELSMSVAALAVQAERNAAEAADALSGASPTAALELEHVPSFQGLHDASLLLLGDARRAAAGPDAAEGEPRPLAEEVKEPWENVLRDPVSLGKLGGESEIESGSEGARRTVNRAATLRRIAAHWRIHHTAVDAADAKRACEAAEAAIGEAEANLPLLHPYLLGSIARLGGAMGERGDAISAEGLYRSATDDLRKVAHGDADKALLSWRPSATIELHSALLAYSSLLKRLQWNGKKRVADARAVEEEAASLTDGQMSQVFATAAARGHSRGNGVAGGALEEWYHATLGVDFLRLFQEQDEQC